jgi:hypothetical protein
LQTRQIEEIMIKILFSVLFLMWTGIAQARITSSADDRDVWCVGTSGAEVCVDKSGNIIPTTDDTEDLGTSSLQFQDGYFDGTVYTDALSNEGAYTGTTGAFTSTLDVDGQTTFGAGLGMSTMSASGVLSVPASIATAILTATTSIAGGAISGSTLDMTGNAHFGATLGAYISTYTASSGAWGINGAVTATGAVQGSSLKASAGPITLTSKTIAELAVLDPTVVGEMYVCSNCSPVCVAVSTGTGAGMFGDAAGIQLD